MRVRVLIVIAIAAIAGMLGALATHADASPVRVQPTVAAALAGAPDVVAWEPGAAGSNPAAIASIVRG